MLWLVDRFHSLVELLCIPMQRSQRLIHCCRVPLRSRLSALRDGVDGRSGEGRRRRRRGGGKISEGVGAGGGRNRHGYWRWGFLCCLALEEDEFAVKKSRFGVRLNNERWKTDRQFSRSTRSQLQRRCVFLGGCHVF